ncbi:MAG: hypothetical protein ACPGVO_16895 [Spirulinaceae cyanobacterium]
MASCIVYFTNVKIVVVCQSQIENGPFIASRPVHSVERNGNNKILGDCVIDATKEQKIIRFDRDMIKKTMNEAQQATGFGSWKTLEKKTVALFDVSISDEAVKISSYKRSEDGYGFEPLDEHFFCDVDSEIIGRELYEFEKTFKLT